MKKYNAPVAKFISLGTEHSMLLNGSDSYAEKEGFEQYSNERERSVSDAIWGNSWED